MVKRLNLAATKLTCSTHIFTSALTSQSHHLMIITHISIHPTFQRSYSVLRMMSMILILLSLTATNLPALHDDISAKMLKGTATSVIPSLTRLFNLSHTTGCFPDTWKLARVVLPNYRPISILSIISKILERVITK